MAAPCFVLVPGAWHGAWCFDLLALELNRRGLRCVRVELPALGDDPLPPSEASFEQGVDRVLEALEKERNVRLLGHSFGSFYAAEASLRTERPPRQLVHLAGWVPVPGDDFRTVSELAPVAPGLREHYEVCDDGFAFRVPAEVAMRRFYSDVPEGFAALAVERLRPQPRAPFREARLSVTERGFGSIRQRAIVAEQDEVIDPAALVAVAERASVPVETVPTGHCPFLSMPRLLADVLLEVS